MTDMSYLVFGLVLGMWANICIRSLRHLTTRVICSEFQRTVEWFSSNPNVVHHIHQISLICDKSVTTQNLAFFNYWYRKTRSQMHF